MKALALALAILAAMHLERALHFGSGQRAAIALLTAMLAAAILASSRVRI